MERVLGECEACVDGGVLGECEACVDGEGVGGVKTWWGGCGGVWYVGCCGSVGMCE